MIVRTPRHARLALAGIVAAAMLSACSSDKTTAPNPTPASIVVSGGGSSIPVGGTTQFAAVVKDADGNVLDVTPTWSVVGGGGTISTGGLFTAGDSAGVFTNTVKATAGNVSSTGSVTITAGALATITVTPATDSLAQGATQQYTAVGKDAHGNVISISPSWSVVSGGAIDTAGLYTAGTAAGTFEQSVVATSGAISDSVSVTILTGALATIVITPSPIAEVVVDSTRQFTAVGKDSNGNVVAMTPTWSIEAGGGTIDGSTGLFTAGTAAGEFANTVKATSGAISATASVTVTPGALTNLAITPASKTLVAGTTQQFTVAGTDAHGNAVHVTPLWQVTTHGGSIDQNGLFTATTVGTDTVFVTADTIAALASVTVTVGPLATITLTPTSLSIGRFGTKQFTAVGKDANGNPVTIHPVWSVSHNGGTVSQGGFYFALAQSGNYTIFAKVGGTTGSAPITVHN